MLDERRRGHFDVPIVRHWGFDVHNLDPDVADALDGHIFCNREKLDVLDHAARPRAAAGSTLFGDAAGHRLPRQRPAEARVHERRRFAEPLSETDGEIHTVCVGRPFNIDFLAAARRGIHVHVYGNSFDDVVPR